jgi:metal-responsive CopG/Arc/MetJ family transcriptional regulator
MHKTGIIMAHVKTAVSLEAPLLKQADGLAREMNVSRSRLFALAVEEFIQRRQNQEILEALNAAYAEPPDSEEVGHIEAIRQYHRELVKED